MGKRKTADVAELAGDEQSQALATLTPLDRLQLNTNMAKLSWEQLLEQAQELEANQVADATELGDGFVLVEGAPQKKHLVGEEFMVLDWEVWPSKDRPGTYFTSMVIKTKEPIDKLGGGHDFRVNDGSTGIHRQLQLIKRSGFEGFIRCRKGLRVSEGYDVTEPSYDNQGNQLFDEVTGRPILKPKVDPMTNQVLKGTTYYLDTSA